MNDWIIWHGFVMVCLKMEDYGRYPKHPGFGVIPRRMTEILIMAACESNLPWVWAWYTYIYIVQCIYVYIHIHIYIYIYIYIIRTHTHRIPPCVDNLIWARWASNGMQRPSQNVIGICLMRKKIGFMLDFRVVHFGFVKTFWLNAVVGM